MEGIAFYFLLLQKYIIQSKVFWNKKKYPFFLGNNSGDFSANNMKETGLNGCGYSFSVDYITFDISNITNIHEYLMKKNYIK